MTRHLDAWNGWSLELPAGWRAGWRDGHVLAGPTDDPDRGVAACPLAREPDETGAALAARVVRAIAAGAPGFEAWEGPCEATPQGELRLVAFRRAGRRGRVRGTVRLSIGPRSAFAGVLQAPEDQLAARLPELEAVLATFRLEAPLPRERFVEPAERAFAFEHPRGWRASGAVQRAAGVTTRWECEDPRTRARVQNLGLTLPFAPAPPLLGFLSPGGGPPFTPADQLCRGLLLQLARRERPDLTLEEVEPSPEVEAAQRRLLAPVEARLGGPATVTAAVAWTAYTEGGVAFREATVVTTWTIAPPPSPFGFAPAGGHWFAALGPSLRAPRELFEQALPVLRGIADSFRVDASWDLREVDAAHRRMIEERQAAERYRARKTQETLDYIHQVQREIQERHAATLSEINRGAFNLIAGKEDVLGEGARTYKVDSGFASYWEKEGRIVGSSSGDLDAHLQADGWKAMKVF